MFFVFFNPNHSTVSGSVTVPYLQVYSRNDTYWFFIFLGLWFDCYSLLLQWNFFDRERETSSPEKVVSEVTAVAMATEKLIESSEPCTILAKAAETKMEDITIMTTHDGELLSEQKSVVLATSAKETKEKCDAAEKEKRKLSQSSTSSFTSSFDLDISPRDVTKTSVQEDESSKLTALTSDVAKDVKEPEKRKRKDKSSKRKSALNTSQGKIV